MAKAEAMAEAEVAMATEAMAAMAIERVWGLVAEWWRDRASKQGG